MTTRFALALEKFHHLTASLNCQNAALRRLLKRAFSDDLERAADAIHRIEADHDAALAAVIWGFFWIRQGEMTQARRELEAIHQSARAETLWGGIALTMLGELCLELGESKTGLKLIRRGEQILGAPI